MILKLKRWQYVLFGVSGILIAVVAWLLWKPKTLAVQAQFITALSQRCQTAMMRDVCTVMKGSAPQASAGRLFIAGIGEVDAQAYAQLRAAGQSMCAELAQACTSDWSGQACSIGKVLYPDLTKAL